MYVVLHAEFTIERQSSYKVYSCTPCTMYNVQLYCVQLYSADHSGPTTKSSSCVHGREGGKTRAAASCAGDPAIFSLLSFITSPLSLFNNHLLSFITYFHNPISLPCQSNQQLDEPKCFTLPCIADAVQRLMKCYLLLGACCCKTSLLCFRKKDPVSEA